MLTVLTLFLEKNYKGVKNRKELKIMIDKIAKHLVLVVFLSGVLCLFMTTSSFILKLINVLLKTSIQLKTGQPDLL